jgi:hypothetical protein
VERTDTTTRSVLGQSWANERRRVTRPARLTAIRCALTSRLESTSIPASFAPPPHNPKVAGSNPARATNSYHDNRGSHGGPPDDGGPSCFWDGLAVAGAIWVAGGASERAGSTVACQDAGPVDRWGFGKRFRETCAALAGPRIRSPRTSRVLQRAQAGGHGASERELCAIHHASVANLRAAVGSFGRVRVHDSTPRWALPRLVVVARGGRLVRQGASPGWREAALADGDG